jgi:hypothetical protein
LEKWAMKRSLKRRMIVFPSNRLWSLYSNLWWRSCLLSATLYLCSLSWFRLIKVLTI